MKFTKYLFIALIAVSIIACTGKQSNSSTSGTNDKLRVVSETVFSFADADTGIEVIDYTYDSPADFFWKKADYKDSAGVITKTVERVFDENKLPIKELTKELGIITSSSETKYDGATGFLLAKTLYDGDVDIDNKKAEYVYTYENNTIVSQEVKRYSQDPEFQNTEGTKVSEYYKLRFLPYGNTAVKGNNPATYLVEFSKYYFTKEDAEYLKNNPAPEGDKVFKIGELYIESKMTFDKEGLPIYMHTGKPDCSHDASEEWYKVEKDSKGRIASIIGFANEKLDSVTDKNTLMTFNYNDKGLVNNIEDYKYNTDTKKYDRFHDAKKIVWNDFGFTNPQNYLFIEKAMINEHYCYGAVKYSVSDRRVIKFDPDEIIIEEYSGFYDGPLKERKVDTKLSKRIVKKLEKLSK